jgi:hypothetical protein
MIRFLGRVGNAVLRPFGLTIQSAQRDFNNLPLGVCRDRMLSALAERFDAWARGQQTWALAGASDTLDATERFFAAYLLAPYRSPVGGSRFNNLLWLHLLARVCRPTVIIDSGTYCGASAWAFAEARLEVPILSFDVDLTRVAKRCPGVQYIQADWTTYDLTKYDLSRALVYFDDHVDQARRLIEAAKRCVPMAIFDDDFPVTSFASMAHAGAALPKLEFVLDDSLRGCKELEWSESGKRYRWDIPWQYLESARACIEKTERLPNTSLVTGIHQTPYRIVQLRQHDFTA